MILGKTVPFLFFGYDDKGFKNPWLFCSQRIPHYFAVLAQLHSSYLETYSSMVAHTLLYYAQKSLYQGLLNYQKNSLGPYSGVWQHQRLNAWLNVCKENILSHWAQAKFLCLGTIFVVLRMKLRTPPYKARTVVHLARLFKMFSIREIVWE